MENIIHPIFSLNPSSSSLSSPLNANDNDTIENLCGFVRGFKRGIDHFPTSQADGSPKYNINAEMAKKMKSENPSLSRVCCAVAGNKKKKYKNKVRKPRFAFRTRSQVDILDDGYRWRKYGQKKVKNEDFPRSYYRCTYQGCNVKKQVQRLSGDESIVVTTYEGMHTHVVDKPKDNFEQILNQMQIYPCSN